MTESQNKNETRKKKKKKKKKKKREIYKLENWIIWKWNICLRKSPSSIVWILDASGEHGFYFQVKFTFVL